MRAMSRLVGQAVGQIRAAFMARVTGLSGARVQVAGLDQELLPEVPVIQQVGFASALPMDAEVVVLPLGAKTAKSVIIATRGGPVVVTALAGETVIYDQFGHVIRLGQSGVRITGNVIVNGSLMATGGVSDSQGSMTDMRAIYNGHLGHNTPNGTPLELM